MKIAKLSDEFFLENNHLIEVLDKDKQGNWNGHKTRGYGVVLIKLADELTFGIPLRSHIRHSECFKTVDDKGLDYSKAVLISNPAHVSEAFKIPAEQYVMIADRAAFIAERFEKYVKRYMLGVQKGDANILRRYTFSTLQNYHAALKI
jgi:protein AbiQ